MSLKVFYIIDAWIETGSCLPELGWAIEHLAIQKRRCTERTVLPPMACKSLTPRLQPRWSWCNHAHPREGPTNAEKDNRKIHLFHRIILDNRKTIFHTCKSVQLTNYSWDINTKKILIRLYFVGKFHTKHISIFVNVAVKSAMVLTKELNFSYCTPIWLHQTRYIWRCNFAKYQCRNNRICWFVLRRI